MNTRKKILLALSLSTLTFTALTVPAQASSSDVNLLNNVMDQQKQAALEAQDTPFNNFKREITQQYAEQGLKVTADDPDGPYTIDGNTITYNSVDGDFSGQGDLKLTHNFTRLNTQTATGNLKTGQVAIPSHSEFLQLSNPQIDVHTGASDYDYQTKSGQLHEVAGRIDKNFIKAEKIDLAGGAYVIYNGQLTRCPAKKPAYYIDASKIEVHPEQEIIFHDAKFVVQGKVIYATKLYRVSLAGKHREHREDSSWFPIKLRLSKSNGLTIGYNYDIALAPKVFGYADLRYSTKTHMHNIYGITWENGHSRAKIESGKFEDSNNHWLTKDISFVYDYNNRIGTTPLTYSFHNEYGRWKENAIKSWHRENGIYISHDPIKLDSQGRYSIYPGIGYKIIHDSYNDSHRNDLHYDATLIGKYTNRLTGYLGYHYSRTNINNSIFKFNQNNFSKEVSLGLGYAPTKLDRVIVATEFNASDQMGLRRLDYYWIHDFNCLQTELHYEQKEKRISLHVDFYGF